MCFLFIHRNNITCHLKLTVLSNKEKVKMRSEAVDRQFCVAYGYQEGSPGKKKGIQVPSCNIH